jgi:hypothetical protein
MDFQDRLSPEELVAVKTETATEEDDFGFSQERQITDEEESWRSNFIGVAVVHSLGASC